MQAVAGEGHHACLQGEAEQHLLPSGIYQLQLPVSAGLAARDMPEMTEQAYLTQLEEQWQPGTQLDSSLCEYAAGRGWLAALQWLRQRGAAWDGRTCSAAACGEHMAVLQWARSQGCPWSTRITDIWSAAVSGHQAFLMWARQQGMCKSWRVRHALLPL